MIHIKYFRDEKQKFQQRYLSASSKNTQSIQYYYLRALGPEQTRVVPRVTNENLNVNVKLEDICRNVCSYLRKSPRSKNGDVDACKMCKLYSIVNAAETILR